MDIGILKEIQVEVENVGDKEWAVPKGKIGKQEKKLFGAVSSFSKKLYTLLDKYDFLCDEMEIKMNENRFRNPQTLSGVRNLDFGYTFL